MEDNNVSFGEHQAPEAPAANAADNGDKKSAANGPLRIKLGLAISTNEYTPENVERIKGEYLARKSVTFRAEQFKNDVMDFDVVEVALLPESTALLFDEVLTDSLELSNYAMSPNSVVVVVDIGGGSTDVGAMQGVEVIPSSEEVFYIGANSALEEVATRVEAKYNLDPGYLDNSYMDLILHHPVAFCSKCGRTDKNPGPCQCGGEYQLKYNILKLGSKSVDVSDIVDAVNNEKADRISEFLIRYFNRLFQTRGLNKTQLDTVIFAGGGSEIYFELVKERIQNSLGNFVEIVKSDRAAWKVLSGLSKYILYKDKKTKKNFDRYVFVDPGNFNVKAKLTDTEGGDIIKPIIMLNKMANPMERANFSVRKPNPMMDLDLEIATADGKAKPGDGRFFVSYLANKGNNPRTRDIQTPKMSDDITNTMVNSAVGVVVARDKAKNN
ncbi:MAG: hypothetical protein FWC55_06670 [Firmicutes bacterium]|nr:hypothetical protein [Bacillota bacterium]